MLSVLIISDEAKAIYSLFKSSEFNFHTQGSRQTDNSPEGDFERLGSYDIAFLDLSGGNWQQKLLDLRLRMPVIAFSGHNLKAAVEAMKLGASDFLEKPLTAEMVGDVILKYKKKILTHKHGFDEIIGTSPPMQEVFGLIKKAAAGESNVLLTGESGTGKELVARAIHRWSPRSDKCFTAINCSAIPDALLESELFGFEKGAFTGANYSKRGLLELAHEGTVFFDEIGDVSALFQSKILRVLQEGEIFRIGGARQIKVDVRIIAATNRDLGLSCQRGTFREDLFYRLNVINIHLPPLRERIEDVPPLVRHFIKKHAAKRKDLMIRCITQDAVNIMMDHAYPGNVRELENIMEHAISFANGPEILSSDLPPYLLKSPARSLDPVPRLNDALSALERKLIIAALNESGGNISRAAAALGIYRQQLQRKIRELRIAI